MAAERLQRFLVERYVPRLDRAAAVEIAQRLEDAASELSGGDAPIRWLHAIALPDEESLLCFLEARTIEQVRRASELAGGDARVQEVISLEPLP